MIKQKVDFELQKVKGFDLLQLPWRFFSNRLSWSKDVSYLVKKANNAVCKLLTSRLKTVFPLVLFKIFDVQIKPIISYASEILRYQR